MYVRRNSIAAAALTLLGALCACQRTGPAGAGGGAALMRNLLRARELEIVAEEKAAQEPLARAAARLRARDPALRFDAVVQETATGHAPRIIVGTTASWLAQRMASSIGVGLVPGAQYPAFRYGDRDFTAQGDGLIATFEDPERPGLPLTLVFANDISTSVQLAGSLMPGWKPWIRVLRAGEVALSGPLDLNGAPRPPDLARPGGVRLATRKILRPMTGAPAGVSGEAAADLPAEVVQRYGRSCVRARESVVAWCPPGTLIPAANVRLWSRPDDYVANGDASCLAHFDPVDGSVDALLWVASPNAASTVDDGGAGVARAGAWTALGAPVQPWMLDAAGIDAAWTWWGRDLDAWLAHVLRSALPSVLPSVLPQSGGGALAIADLVDAQACERISAHLVSPLRGALWRFLRETRGNTFARELWQGTRALDATAALDTAFAAWLRARTAAAGADVERARAEARADALSMGVLRGAGTCERACDERTGARRGYGSRAFEAGVDAARASGADALLVTAIGCNQPGLPALFGDDAALQLGPRDGDVRIWAALTAARARGMRTILVPELVSSEGGTWSGTWSRSDADQWRAFFERHARFVEHHALLAELSGASVLSLGTGLSAISAPDPEGRRTIAAEKEWKSDGWARVIGAARAAFPGSLVYSATSVEELEKVAFFPELDLVGFALAPTLEYDDPWDGRDAPFEIEAGIRRTLAALERVAAASDRRVLLTQAAFSPDLHGAARVLGPRTASREWQARQFGLLASSLRSWSGRGRLAGVCAWRWAADDEESSIGEHDPVIETPQTRAAVGALWRGL